MNPWDIQLQEKILSHSKVAPNYHRFANVNVSLFNHIYLILASNANYQSEFVCRTRW